MEHVSSTEIVIKKASIHGVVFILPILVTVLLFAIYEPLGVIGIIYLIYAILQVRMTELIISTKRLHGKYGIIHIHQMDSPLTRVNDINIHKGLLGELLGYGDLDIRTGSGTFYYKKIANPELIRNTILNAADEMEEGRFERQSRRYEETIQEQTMMQAHGLNQISHAISEETISPTPVNLYPEIEAEHVEQIEKSEEKKNCTSGTVKKKKENPLWIESCPILISECMIEEMQGGNGIQLNMEIQNLSLLGIEALYLDIQGFDVLKHEKCFLKEIPILDLDIANGEKHMIPKAIDLPEPSIRRVNVYIRHVVFSDESVWSFEEEKPLREMILNQTPIDTEFIADVDQLCQKNNLSRNYHTGYSYYPVYTKFYWGCACGQFNIGEICARCKASKEKVRQLFSRSEIEARHVHRIEEENLEREKWEREEAQRKAEEERIQREREEAERIRRQQREAEIRQKAEQVQNQAQKLFGAVRGKAEGIKMETMKQAENLKMAAVNQVDNIKKEAYEQTDSIKLEENGTVTPTSNFVCKKCGFENDADAKFCIKCGHMIREDQ
ncbi:MAG: zinc ribbon domain-containing protein [Lachnospiraceae bacterium]|nr:zinc ribbon domain-containing protein [Lachnospiraceae bacterium]